MLHDQMALRLVQSKAFYEVCRHITETSILKRNMRKFQNHQSGEVVLLFVFDIYRSCLSHVVYHPRLNVTKNLTSYDLDLPYLQITCLSCKP